MENLNWVQTAPQTALTTWRRSLACCKSSQWLRKDKKKTKTNCAQNLTIKFGTVSSHHLFLSTVSDNWQTKQRLVSQILIEASRCLVLPKDSSCMDCNKIPKCSTRYLEKQTLNESKCKHCSWINYDSNAWYLYKANLKHCKTAELPFHHNIGVI